MKVQQSIQHPLVTGQEQAQPTQQAAQTVLSDFGDRDDIALLGWLRNLAAS